MMKLNYLLPMMLLSVSCFSKQEIKKVPFHVVNKSRKTIGFRLKTSKSFRGEDVSSWNSKYITIKPQSEESSGSVHVDTMMTTNSFSGGVFEFEIGNSYRYKYTLSRRNGGGFYCEIYSRKKINCERLS